ncbi:MAG TPA: AAA family ATPase [Aggregatilineales bacterium]|nr:AAA family ATPase [Aggregatilineales bacterium]
MMTPVFMLVGPPAVGKSTTSRALAAHFARSLHIPVDDLRMMVVSGLALPGLDWSAALVEQLRLARSTVTHMALTYQQAGFAVVIDDFQDPGLNADYAALFNQVPVQKVVLYPTQEEAHRRNLQRSGDSPARTYIDEGIREVYRQLNPIIPQLTAEGWLILDTTEMSVEATVQTLVDSASTS